MHVPGFFKLLLSVKSECVHVRLPMRLLITSGMLWHDMDPYNWLNKFYNYRATVLVIGIICRHGLSIDVCHRCQPNRSKLALYYRH